MAKDLERNMARDADGEMDGLYWGPEPSLPSELLSPAIEHMLMSAGVIEAMFKIGRKSKLKQIRKRAEQMSEALGPSK